MAGAVVQAAWGARQANGSSCTVACPVHPTTGNCIVALVLSATGLTANAPTDTLGNTYSTIFSDTADGGNSGWNLYAYVAAGITGGGANTLTVTMASGDEGMVSMIELSGIATSSPLDGNAVNWGSGSSSSNGIASPSATNSNTAFVIGFSTSPNQATSTEVAGTSPISFTSSTSGNITAQTTAWGGSGTSQAMFEWAASVAPGSHKATFTDTTNGASNSYYAAIIMLDEKSGVVPAPVMTPLLVQSMAQ